MLRGRTFGASPAAADRGPSARAAIRIFRPLRRRRQRDAGLFQFAAQPRQIPMRHVFEIEREIHVEALVFEEEQYLVEFIDVFVEKMLVDHGLASAVRHERRPQPLGLGIGAMQCHRSTQTRASDAFGVIAQSSEREGKIGEARPTEQRFALLEEVGEVQGRCRGVAAELKVGCSRTAKPLTLTPKAARKRGSGALSVLTLPDLLTRRSR